MSVSVRFTNLAIRTKILFSFMMILLLLTGMGLNALQRSGGMNAKVEDLTRNYALAVVYLDEMRVSVASYRGALSTELLQINDKTARQSAPATFERLTKTFDANDALYARTVDPGTEAQRYVELKAAWSGLLTISQQVHDLLAADKITEAASYAFASFAPAASRAEAAVHASMDYNVDAVKRLTEEVDTDYSTGRLYLVAFMVFAVIGAILAGTVLVRSIAVPIKSMTEAMRRLAAHDMTTQIPARDRTDEIGQMAAAVQVFKDVLIAADRQALDQASERTQKEQRTARLEHAVGRFEASARDMVGLLASGSTELEASARAMSGSADRTNQQASAVAAAAEEAGTGVQTVAAATEELTASINEISRQVAQSADMAARAVADTQRTNAIVAALVEGADKIGNVVGLIASIAGQTNLLALNATIEAARAGDAGKGFAVVASEVKNLASQTGKATEEIGAQITQIQSATKEAVTAIRDIAATIEGVSAIATTIAAAVEEQGAATAEIARNIQQTAAAAQGVTSNIGGVGQSANDSSAAAGEVLSAAGDLSKQAERLSSEVNAFVA
ncbi:MAG: methyl-accepting chemotaxis protein, partial [Acetobacteraceae bacterium]|nr:methyl-accepting chemotaxis protein [Acetobacteraceae bacterium]